jgi:hypothetical protein
VPSLTQTSDHEPSAPVECVHRMRVVGYVLRSERTRMDCAQPLRAVCLEGCGHEAFWRCDCSAASKCPDCSERRRKLIARLVDLGATERATHGHLYFVTLSAPGENEHRQWVQVGGAGVKRLPRDRPDCHCHRVWEHAHRGDWNATESACWNRLRTALRRRHEALTYIGSVEVQERGMLHRHLVIHTQQPLTASEVGDLALTAGYGCVHDVQPILSASKAAWYISKYVTKSSGDRANVPWRADVLDEDTGELRRMETMPTFRTWSSAQSWGFTLKGLRELARMQARARAKYLEELTAALAEDAAAAPTPDGHERQHPPPI